MVLPAQCGLCSFTLMKGYSWIFYGLQITDTFINLFMYLFVCLWFLYREWQQQVLIKRGSGKSAKVYETVTKMKFLLTSSLLFKHSSDENEESDPQGQVVLIIRQILLTSSIRNVWRTVRRICIFISGLKGLTFFETAVLRNSIKVHEASKIEWTYSVRFSRQFEHLAGERTSIEESARDSPIKRSERYRAFDSAIKSMRGLMRVPKVPDPITWY